MIFCDNMLKSFNEYLKQLTKINDFLLFLRFHETVLFCTVFIADMNSACKNTLVSVYLLNLHLRHIFLLILSKAIALRLSLFSQKFENF